ncbi:hypothetical protein RIF25_12935 [Thermosynechococcaceae cyanobacterium BACA0444]|uniref:CRISPR type III-B/RAMP module-associated protein Cmr5 n=1 Tax=Pseudocalidococcus azoricus BACA0444 TaxID=2918990 RepID=A0AAE4FSW5_9CYAN|nr:hypothetical protein [Pseudocalidococcus azoricus]MDS3861708.1 hypothetical protein [Pseudocalidococcus azoricus BACA0444]
MIFDPRTIGTPVYEALAELRNEQEQNQRDPEKRKKQLKEQKNQAVELYTYLSTWGLLRLKAEEKAISDEQKGKKQVVKAFFECLEQLAKRNDLSHDNGLNTLTKLTVDEYLGLTGLGLALAQEFSFWATAVYHDVKDGDSE